MEDPGFLRAPPTRKEQDSGQGSESRGTFEPRLVQTGYLGIPGVRGSPSVTVISVKDW